MEGPRLFEDDIAGISRAIGTVKSRVSLDFYHGATVDIATFSLDLVFQGLTNITTVDPPDAPINYRINNDTVDAGKQLLDEDIKKILFDLAVLKARFLRGCYGIDETRLNASLRTSSEDPLTPVSIITSGVIHWRQVCLILLPVQSNDLTTRSAAIHRGQIRLTLLPDQRNGLIPVPQNSASTVMCLLLLELCLNRYPWKNKLLL